MKYRFHQKQPIRWPRRKLQQLATTCFEKAQVYGKQGDSEKCMEYLNRAHQYDLTNLEYLWIIANRWFENDNEKAVDALSRIIEIGTNLDDLEEARSKRAISYGPLGKTEKVIEDLDWLIKHDPRTAHRYEWRGECRFKLGHVEEAIEDFSEAMRLSPDDHMVLWRRAEAYTIAHRYMEARQDLTQYHEIFGISLQSEWFYVIRGRVYYHLGRHEEALEDFRKVSGVSRPLEDSTAYMRKFFRQDVIE